ncbi:hypothetical protein [Rhodosalinus sp. FB01]|uniref:hypothetical protein n=1 Tax=Rhodosalinus sp. FB01 TaxID=3239194 RepID=UPI0035242FC7
MSYRTLHALTCAALLAATPLAAAEPMNAEEFDAYTRGKTLYYGQSGQAYGVEEYKDDREVVWSFLDGECIEGRWYEDARGYICFVYEDDRLGPQCWQFFRAPGGGLTAIFEDDTAVPLYEAGESDEPMQCLGPEVGV